MVQLTRQFALFKQTILNDTRSVGIQLLKFLLISCLALIIFIAQSNDGKWRELDGRYLFEAIFIVNLFFILATSLFLFMPLVKEEKEENTLGLILMTGISPFAYLSGKVGSRLVMMLIILSIQIPIVYLCITLGGIDLNTILTAYSLLILIGFFLGTAFLLGSLIGSSAFTCLLITAGITLVFSYIGNYALQTFYHSSQMDEPFIVLDRCLSSIFSSRAMGISDLVISYFIFLFFCSLIFFGASVYFFDTLIADQKEIDLSKKIKSEESSKQKASSLEGKGLKPLYRKLKTKRFGKLPLIYKDFRFTCYGSLLYILQFVVMLIGIITVIYDGYYYYGHWLFNMVEDGPSFMFFQSAIVLMICSNIVFSTEVKNKTLNSLLLLPQTHTRLYWHKSLCVLRIAAPSIICFLIVKILDIYLDSYFRLDRTLPNLIIMFSIIVPGYFINTWLSLVFKKYSFFLSNGLTFAWFAFHLFLLDITALNRDFEAFAIIMFVSGIISSVLALLGALSRLEKHGITS